MDPKNNIRAPVPRRGSVDPLERPASAFDRIQCDNKDSNLRPLTPNINNSSVPLRRPSYISIESSREKHYNLDYPDNNEEIEAAFLDPKSRFFARRRPRTLNLPHLLPYQTEDPKDQAKFLSHIVSHLYIAIRTGDLQGALSVTPRDLAAVKANLSDVDMALETNLFEAPSTAPHNNDDDDDEGYFSVDELANESEESFDSDSEEDDDEPEDEEDGDDVDSAQQFKKQPRSAAVVGIKIWTRELLVWMRMKYEMPVSLRIALARVYYAICLSRGQSINLKIYVKAFEMLTKDHYFMRDQGLKLQWKPLLEELESFLPNAEHPNATSERKDRRQLFRLAERASFFFEKESLPIIYSRIGSRFSITSAANVYSSMGLLPPVFNGGIEDKYDIRHYISSFFYTWEKIRVSSSFPTDKHLVVILGKIAMAAMIDYKSIDVQSNGVFSTQQINFIFSQLLNSLGIQPNKYNSTKATFFHGYASAIVFSMVGDSDFILQKLHVLVNAVQSYVHPSNTGEWSRAISRMVFALAYQFHKRFNMQSEKDGLLFDSPYKVSQKAVSKFVQILLPLVHTGIQSKGAKVSEDYQATLKLITHLDTPMVLETILLDLYESLEGVLSTHRVGVALRTLEDLARYFAATPIYRVHVARLLSMTLPGIDSNDVVKSAATIGVFGAFANFVPFYDLENGSGDSMLALQFTSDHLEWLQRKQLNPEETIDISSEVEISALKSSTTSFKDLYRSFCQKIFTLFENFPDPWKSGGVEKDFAEILPKIFFVIIESLSDDIFDVVVEEWFNFISENVLIDIIDMVADICGGLIKRKPSLFVKFANHLIERIREAIDENGAGTSRTLLETLPRDRPLLWNIMILNGCIGDAGSEVIQMKKELTELSCYLMDKVKVNSTSYVCSYMVCQLLKTTTKARILESRLISPYYEGKYGIDEKCWGGFQFSDVRLQKENLQFKWFLPGEKEITFAVDVFTDHIMRILKKISEVMKAKQNVKGDSAPVSMSDELYVLLLYLGYSISGMAYLFDPSFNEDIPNISSHSSQTIQQRLMLLNQIRSVSSSNIGKDEPRSENFHENFQKIVNDLDENGISLDLKEDRETLMQVDKPTENEEPSSRQTPMSFSGENSPRASPLVDEDILNPGLTFRDNKLYTSNYFFGDDADERRNNEMYIKIHHIRHVVGKTLHVIYKFLSTHFSDNSNLFKAYLHALVFWFCNVGRDVLIEASHSSVNVGYVSGLQHVNKMRKPYTRIAIGARLESYHSLRVALHATSRTQTDIEKILVEDLVKICFSSYSSIASNAQNVLTDTMKRLNGSYNVLIKNSLRLLAKALNDDDHEKIVSGLDTFALPSVKNKIQNDYFNIQKYVELLHRCMLVDHPDVNESAMELYRGVYNNISPPSSVCLINNEEIDVIRPPDEFIDLEVNVVKMAKDSKRKIYFEKLDKLLKSVFSNEKANTYWRLSSLNLCLLINLQLEHEIPVNADILQLLIKEAGSDHPVVARIAQKGIANIESKIMSMGYFDNSITNYFDLNYIPNDRFLVDISKEKSPHDYWINEMKNTKSPNFFIDNNGSYGFFFWDSKNVAIKPGYLTIDLKGNEKIALETIASYLTKDWFLGVVNLWIAENDSNLAFQTSDVFLTEVVARLVSSGLTKGMTFEDLISIIPQIYEKDEKSTHLVVCELITGMLLASKNTKPEHASMRDDFLCEFLGNIYDNELTPDNSGVWNIFSWWLPTHVDVRRFPKLVDRLFLKYKVDPNSDAAVRISTRIGFIETFVITMLSAFPYSKELSEFAFANLNNSYQVINESIGTLITVLSYVHYLDSVESSEKFIGFCNEHGGRELFEIGTNNEIYNSIPKIFEFIEASRLEVLDKTPQEILTSNFIYASKTVLKWLSNVLMTSIGILYQDYVESYIMPFLLKLLNLKDVCKLGNLDPITVIKQVSQIPYSDKNVETIIQMIEEYSTSDSLTVIQSIIMGEFTETFYFKNLYKFSPEQINRIISLINGLIYHKNVAVREASSSTLSGLIHFSPPDTIDDLVQELSSGYKRDLDKTRKKYKKGFKSISSEDMIKLHGATLGLGSLIHAFPFSSPPPLWVPELLVLVANKCSGIPGDIGNSAKDILGKFRKNRQDTWHIDSKVFNEDQIQDLEGIFWKSYFV